MERSGGDAGQVLRIDKLSAPLLERIENALAILSQHSGVSVVAVEHVVRFESVDRSPLLPVFLLPG